MRKLFILILIFSLNDLYSQCIDNYNKCMDTLSFSFEENENIDEREIVEEGFIEYYDYIEFEKELPVGYIIKFILINPDSIIFSITYFHNRRNLSDFGPFNYYTILNNEKYLLMYSSDSIKREYDGFITDLFYTINSDDFLNQIKFKTEIVAVDVFFEGIVKYSNKQMTIEICPDFRTPFKYKPQSDEYLWKLLKRLKIMDERDSEK